MKKRKSIQNTRRAKRAESIADDLIKFGYVTFTDSATLYFNQSPTTITLDTAGFAVGDILIISGGTQPSMKHKKKVHIARRRIKAIAPSYTITDISSNNITVAANSLLSVQKVSNTQWIINGYIV